MKFKSLAAMAALSAALLSGFGAAQAAELRLGTASQGGAFYPVGQAVSTLVSKYAGNDTTMVPIVTEGSVQNPRLLGSGEVDAGITNNNLAVLANKNIGPFDAAANDMVQCTGGVYAGLMWHMKSRCFYGV